MADMDKCVPIHVLQMRATCMTADNEDTLKLIEKGIKDAGDATKDLIDRTKVVITATERALDAHRAEIVKSHKLKDRMLVDEAKKRQKEQKAALKSVRRMCKDMLRRVGHSSQSLFLCHASAYYRKRASWLAHTVGALRRFCLPIAKEVLV